MPCMLGNKKRWKHSWQTGWDTAHQYIGHLRLNSNFQEEVAVLRKIRKAVFGWTFFWKSLLYLIAITVNIVVCCESVFCEIRLALMRRPMLAKNCEKFLTSLRMVDNASKHKRIKAIRCNTNLSCDWQRMNKAFPVSGAFRHVSYVVVTCFMCRYDMFHVSLWNVSCVIMTWGSFMTQMLVTKFDDMLTFPRYTELL